MSVELRLADAADAGAIAALHADSWRRHYRGAYSDAFLDGDVLGDRQAVWSARLGEPDDRSRTVVAIEPASVVGFVHVVFEEDPVWGALLDNLHVVSGRKRHGIGSRLLGDAVLATVARGTGLYLWVQEQNVDAQAFYEARGGRIVEREPIAPPGGIAARLNGEPFKLRCVWEDPRTALAAVPGG